MEAFVMSYLKDTFDVWLKNFDPKRDMTVRTIKGEATIHNMQLNDEVIRELVGFESLEVTRLNVSSCLINVSPTKIMTVPTVVELGDVDIVLTELETPRALPQVYAQLLAKREQNAKPEKDEQYGMSDKIADGVRLSAKHIQIVVRTRPLRSAYDTSEWPVPLLVISVRDFVLQQTDSEWNVVDLKSARRHNKGTDAVHVFRQATCAVSVHLVPFRNDPNEAAAALLRGVKLESFVSRHDASGQPGAVLGSTVIIKDLPLTLRSILHRRTRDKLSVNAQLDLLLPKVQLRFAPRDQALLQDFLAAWTRIASRANLIADQAAAAKAKQAAASKTGAAPASKPVRPAPAPPSPGPQGKSPRGVAPNKAPARPARGAKPVQPQMLRPPTLTSTLIVFFGSEDPSKAKPGVVLRIFIAKVIIDLHGVPPAPSAGTSRSEQRRHPLVTRMVARVERIHITMQQQICPPPRNDELGMQVDVGWFQCLTYTADNKAHPKPLAFPAAEHEPISGFLSIARDIHPFTSKEDNYERSTMFRCSYIDRMPCPPPPLYGKELQIRLRRLEVFLREEDFDFLCAFALTAERLRYKPAPPPSTSGPASLAESRRASNSSLIGLPPSAPEEPHASAARPDNADPHAASVTAPRIPSVAAVASPPTLVTASAAASSPAAAAIASPAAPPQLPPRRETPAAATDAPPALPPRQPRKHDESAAMYYELVAMGFEPAACKKALYETVDVAPHQRLEAAITWILDHDDEPPAPEVLQPPSPRRDAGDSRDATVTTPSVSPSARASAAPASAPVDAPSAAPVTAPSPAPMSATQTASRAEGVHIAPSQSNESLSSISTVDSSATAARTAALASDAASAADQVTRDQEEAEYAAMLLQAATAPYNSFSCMVDVNGPTVHVFPRAFNAPVFTIRLSKIVCAGHGDLPLPVFALHTSGTPSSADPNNKGQKEYFTKAPRPTVFPDVPADYVGERIRVGLGKQATKLEVFILPFSMLLLGGLRVSPGDDDEGAGYNPTEDTSRPSVVTSSHATPIAKFGETQIGISWDDTASPQLMVSVMTNKIEIPLAQDMLHFLYLIAEEYSTSGAADFYNSLMQMDSDFQWTDLLRYLPNPTGEPLPDRISGYTVIPLLPTYAVGLLWKNLTLTLNQNGSEVAKAVLLDTSLVMEHQVRTTHMVVGKFFVRDASMSAVPRGMVVERRQSDGGLLIAARVEDEVREAMKLSERRMRLLQQQQQQQQQGDAAAAGPVNATVTRAVDRLGDLERAAQAALDAERANRLSTTFALLRDYVQNRQLFRKNGFHVQLGVVDLILNIELFATLATFFTADATPATRRKFETLRLSGEASAHAMQQLALLAQRGRYYTKAETESDVKQGLYGVPPAPSDALARKSADTPTATSATAATPAATSSKPREPVYSVPAKDAPPPRDTAVPAHKAALQALDRLSAMLAVLQDVARDMDREQMAVGEPVLATTVYGAKAPPGKMIVPMSSLPNELRRRGNERLLAQWQALHRSLADALREQDQLKRLVALEWPGEFSAPADDEQFDDADVPLQEALPAVATLDIASLSAPGNS